MARSIPKLRSRTDGRAVVTLCDSTTGQRRDYSCGQAGSAEALEVYARLIRIWKSNGRRLPQLDGKRAPDAGQVTIGRLLVEFNRYITAQKYSDGEARALRTAMRIVRELYGGTQAAAFTPPCLELCREAMIDRGWSRKSINRQVGRIRQVFKFGASRGLIDVRVYDALRTVAALRRGRSNAREPKPVRPVRQDMIDATLAHLSPPVAALVRVQLLTGARSGELCIMRPCDIDRTGKVWAYRPTDHKTAHHGHDRTIYIGPAAQVIVAPLLNNRPPASFVFSPHDAQGRPATKARLSRYTPQTYHRAVVRGCDLAYPPPDDLARRRVKAPGHKRERWETNVEYRKRLGDRWAELQSWRKDHRWHPHQLRHNAATRLRAEFGIEMARIILGHKTIDVTAGYAEADAKLAREAMLKIG